MLKKLLRKLIIPKKKPLVILSIAGSDNSSGAGIQADIKTAKYLNAYCLTTLTCITSQNSQKVSKVFPIPVSVVLSQIEMVKEEYNINGVKIGLLTDYKLVNPLKKILSILNVPIVIDPIYQSTNGKKFMNKKEFVNMYFSLSKIANFLTPNLNEAKLLLSNSYNKNFSKKEILSVLYNKFRIPIILTGGEDNENYSNDLLISKKGIKEFKLKKVKSNKTHGSGCSFSTALTIYLANGETIEESIRLAKQYIKKTILNSPSLGIGYGPIS